MYLATLRSLHSNNYLSRTEIELSVSCKHLFSTVRSDYGPIDTPGSLDPMRLIIRPSRHVTVNWIRNRTLRLCPCAEALKCHAFRSQLPHSRHTSYFFTLKTTLGYLMF
ncbi:hypothetical protein EYF80_066888 [Liparis tanakae]|uniref:Uncharacterized protein n=1 Tax=Liparis tanakae TaxID=230148 RepID=A0A4Z2E281_9TELE|nr:hypothetical protein EYF80_066888 [Liparis tanakae]